MLQGERNKKKKWRKTEKKINAVILIKQSVNRKNLQIFYSINFEV